MKTILVILLLILTACNTRPKSLKKIAIIPGSFDPPTIAHFELGTYLLKEKIVDEVSYVVNFFGPKNYLTSNCERRQMLSLVFKQMPNAVHIDRESFSGRDGHSEKLKKNTDYLVFDVVGADGFINIPLSIRNNPHKHWLVFTREGHKTKIKESANIKIIQSPTNTTGISSSKIRENIKKNENSLAPNVRRWIHHKGFYAKQITTSKIKEIKDLLVKFYPDLNQIDIKFKSTQTLDAFKEEIFRKLLDFRKINKANAIENFYKEFIKNSNLTSCESN